MILFIDARYTQIMYTYILISILKVELPIPSSYHPGSDNNAPLYEGMYAWCPHDAVV